MTNPSAMTHAELVEEVIFLRSRLNGAGDERAVSALRVAYPMQRLAARVALVLYGARRLLTYDEIMERIYDGRSNEPNQEIIKVVVCGARRALGACSILNVYGTGYMMTEVGRAVVGKVLRA